MKPSLPLTDGIIAYTANPKAYVATVEQLDSRLRGPRDSSALSTLDLRGRRPVIVETGVGASTIVLLNFAMKHDGLLYSWDPNGPKGALLRSVCTDTLVTHHQKLLQQHWKFVPYNSHSVHLGLPILGELDETVDFCFFDSEHTREVLIGELARVSPFLSDGAIVSIDD